MKQQTKNIATSNRASGARRAGKTLRACALAVGALSVTSATVLAPGLVRAEQGASEKAVQRAMPASFADVVERVSPAVVNIQVTSRETPAMASMQGVPQNRQEFLERFFGMPMPNQPRQGEERVGAGSGFAIDPEGHIVTNVHVVHDADEIVVTFKDGMTAKAKLVGTDEKTDLALLKIDVDKPVPFVKFGNSDDVRVGDWIVTVGNPFGLGHSVNVGVVSARGRTIGAGPYDDFLQIDAQINRGNSGGPAFDVAGNVIGVNSAIYSPNGGNVGIGFAIPSTMAKNVIAQLKENGVVERGWLGVSIQPVTDDIAEGLGRDNKDGALVADVMADGPAMFAGIKAGDVILKVGSEKIAETRELPRVIADIKPGTQTRMEVWRDGKTKSINVDIARQPTEKKVADASTSSEDVGIGLALKSLDKDAAQQMGLPDGSSGVVIVEVRPGSPAAEKGLQPGDLVTEVNGQKVRSPGDLKGYLAEAKKKAKSSALALVKRGDTQRFVALPVGTA